MTDYKILSDSSCDIPESTLKEYDIDLVHFYVSFDQNKYYMERVELPADKFYKTLRTENVFPKTSLPSVQDYIDKFKIYLDKGMDIVCFCLTPNFSGSYQSAVNAKNILSEEYPNSRIEIINSHQATGGQGLVVLEGARMKKNGFSIDELVEKMEQVTLNSRIVFTVDSLEYLAKGGRIGKASSLLGSIFNIKPLIVLRKDELLPVGKIRGRKKAIKELFSLMEKEMGSANYNDYNYIIVNADCLEEAENLKMLLEQQYNIKVTYPTADVGITIGSHTGPTALGICFIRKYETL